jgi:hypothetical protein
MESKFKSFINTYFWKALAVVVVSYIYWNPIFLNHLDYYQTRFPKEDGFSKDFFSFLQDGNAKKIFPLLEPTLQGDSDKFISGFRTQESQWGEIQAIHMTMGSDVTDKDTNLKYENFEYLIDFKKASASYGIALIPQSDTFKVYGIHFWHLKSFAYDEVFPFRLNGRSWLEFLFLLLGYGIFLACGLTFVSCAQSDISGRWSKGSWMLFILLGSIDFTMNWLPSSVLPVNLGNLTATSAGIKFFTIFPAGILKIGIYNPWKVWISIPVGLIFYYWKKPYSKKEDVSKTG